jgi:hypothetical protein
MEENQSVSLGPSVVKYDKLHYIWLRILVLNSIGCHGFVHEVGNKAHGHLSHSIFPCYDVSLVLHILMELELYNNNQVFYKS